MSRYRRSNSGSGIMLFIVTLISVAAVVVGAVFHTEIGAWAKKLKEKLTDDKKQEQVEGTDDGATVNEEWKDFYLEHQSVKYGNWGSGASIRSHCHYVFSEEKYQEIVNDENKVLYGLRVRYSLYEKAMNSGVTLEEELEKYFLEDKDLLDEELSNRFFNLPERYVDDEGNVKYLYSAYNASAFTTYSDLNTRKVNVVVIATKGEDGTYSFEYPSLKPGKSYGDWDVMSTPVYMASRYLNAVSCEEETYNEEVVKQCREAISKGVAQAKGVSESAYVAGEHTLTVDTSEKLQLKVGETKQLVVPITPNIGVQIVYNVRGFKEGDTAPTHYDYVTVTESGAVTAKKAGKCSIGVMIAGVEYYVEVEITE